MGTQTTQHFQSGPVPVPSSSTGPSGRPEHLFIHAVRFWSMAAIVLMHTAEKITKYQPLSRTEMNLIVQPFKFGTIAFFLISGFLLGDRLPSSKPLAYLRRRASRLFPAWLVWYGLLVLLATVADLRHQSLAALKPALVAHSIGASVAKCLVDTPLWFVPNFMIALTCVVLLRRWLNDLRVGATLVAVNLIYAANVYFGWMPKKHTEALFAFVLYLWLGAWCAQRKERFETWVRSIPVAVLVLFALAAALVANWETSILLARSSADPLSSLNTLRFGNQLYSVAVTLLLVRIRRRTWPAFVNVAQTTYGIYLIHGLVITLVFSVAATVVFAPGHTLGMAGTVLLWAVLGAIAYMLTLQFVRWIASSPQWGWAVGASSPEPLKSISRTALPDSAMTPTGA